MTPEDLNELLRLAGKLDGLRKRYAAWLSSEQRREIQRAVVLIRKAGNELGGASPEKKLLCNHCRRQSRFDPCEWCGRGVSDVSDCV